MTDDSAATRQGLDRALALFPDEIAAAERLAAGQARAMATMADEWPADAGTVLPAIWPGEPSRLDDAAADMPPHRWPLARIAQAFASGACDPVRLLDHQLARIAAVDPQIDSIVALDRDGARQAADASARRWAAGTALGPLDGVPVGVKDVIDVAGMPTRCHSRLTSTGPAASDAAVVATLRAAGAVILAKLATHEFAIGGPAFDLPRPPARNPWNRDHHPGGSSSGASAAVAAGLVPLAVGTDTAGSVRNPASACGIVGLKPTRGILPLDGVFPLAWTLDHVGLLTRSVADMRIAAAALGLVGPTPAPGRIGYVRHFHSRDMIATPETAAALDRVAAALGAREVALPPLGAFALVNRVILQSEGFAIHAGDLRRRPEQFSALTRAALLAGAFTSAETLLSAYRRADALTGAVDRALGEVDVLLTASSMEPACRIDDPAEIARSYMLQARTPFNVTGHPALAMAAGVSAGGLPLSVQFAGRHGDEARVLAAAAAWETAMGGPLPAPIA